ncbi:ABC transporter permease [Pseudaestuariivita atlantica]|uniref:Peptide ABC transporter n=1 Tax=Pseudaestuariivita atlantica TaxID=1317121 RepID=A0A0L1JQF5_9RHOB|nr:ABC transporter permease [Pseudaestuariivita atlantica]KNG93976.1 peptide ABC transporter [Pseudaestuariivita atlantica]
MSSDPTVPLEDSVVSVDGESAVLTRPPRSQWREVWDQFKSHKGALFGAVVFLLITAGVFVGPVIWRIDPQFLPQGRDFLTLRDTRPIYVALWDSGAKVNWAHPLGTDNLGRDMLARLMFGGRVSIAVGLTAMVLSLVLGTAVGVIAGYFKRLDGPLMRLTDLFLALPLLPLILVASLLFRDPLAAVFGTEGGIFILIVALIGITSWMQTARIVRGDVLALKEREFVLAAKSIGTRPGALITRHMLPNILSPIMVSATLGIASAIITESALSFLGFGFPPDFPTWGRLLNDGVDRLVSYPERSILPGILISLVVLSVNYLGDGLRDALDPRIRGR